MKYPVSFTYNKVMLPFFEEGFSTFQKETMIALTGIDFKIENGSLVVTVTEPQQEKWLFHLAFTVGIVYAKRRDNADTAIAYLKHVYGLDPNDLDLDRETITMEEIERQAEKWGLTKQKDMTLDKARMILNTVGIKI